MEDNYARNCKGRSNNGKQKRARPEKRARDRGGKKTTINPNFKPCSPTSAGSGSGDVVSSHSSGSNGKKPATTSMWKVVPAGSRPPKEVKIEEPVVTKVQAASP